MQRYIYVIACKCAFRQISTTIFRLYVQNTQPLNAHCRLNRVKLWPIRDLVVMYGWCPFSFTEVSTIWKAIMVEIFIIVVRAQPQYYHTTFFWIELWKKKQWNVHHFGILHQAYSNCTWQTHPSRYRKEKKKPPVQCEHHGLNVGSWTRVKFPVWAFAYL